MHRFVRIMELFLVSELLAGLHHLVHRFPVDRRLQVLEQIAFVVLRNEILFSIELVEQHVSAQVDVILAQTLCVPWRRFEVQQNVISLVLFGPAIGRICRVSQSLVEFVVAKVLDFAKNAPVLQNVQADLLDAFD